MEKKVKSCHFGNTPYFSYDSIRRKLKRLILRQLFGKFRSGHAEFTLPYQK